MQEYNGYVESGQVFPIGLLAGIQGRRRVKITVLDESVREKSEAPKKDRRAAFGCLKGKINVPDDFNDPLDDFKEYM